MIAAATTPPKLSTLVLLTALSVLSLNMFLPSLSNMVEDLETDYALVSLSIAGYLAITSFLQLIMGPLSDRFGRRPVLLAGLVIFSFASLVCALATNIWVFLAFRLLQGAVISGAALSRAVIRDIAPEQEAASDIANARADARWHAGGVIWLAGEFYYLCHLGHCGFRLVLGRSGRNEQVAFPNIDEAVPNLSRTATVATFLGLCTVHDVFNRSILFISRRSPVGGKGAVCNVACNVGILCRDHHGRLHIR